MHAIATTPVGLTGLSRSCFSGQRRPSPLSGRVGSHIVRFEACLAFTRVTACMLAESPYATLLHRSASARFVTSSHRPDCFRLERPVAGWDSHPLEIAVFARRTG
jgi:hypothetical protein